MWKICVNCIEQFPDGVRHAVPLKLLRRDRRFEETGLVIGPDNIHIKQDKIDPVPIQVAGYIVQRARVDDDRIAFFCGNLRVLDADISLPIAKIRCHVSF